MCFVPYGFTLNTPIPAFIPTSTKVRTGWGYISILIAGKSHVIIITTIIHTIMENAISIYHIASFISSIIYTVPSAVPIVYTIGPLAIFLPYHALTTIIVRQYLHFKVSLIMFAFLFTLYTFYAFH